MDCRTQESLWLVSQHIRQYMLDFLRTDDEIMLGITVAGGPGYFHQHTQL
ncbi:hypothetical protein [Neptuniibacter sp.]|nr:hypothetical protein [Neptuniibacter sp.]MCP4598525.1 hypothetical protein [Neptuniibacter sp.]